MFERIQAFSMPAGGSRPQTGPSRRRRLKNEDALCFGPGHLVVIDGATGLTPVHLTSAPTDAAWMAARLAVLMDRMLSLFPTRPTAQLLERCAALLREELDELGYRDSGAGYPSACVSVVRILDHRLHCFALGDVAILLRDREGSLLTLRDRTVPDRDQQVIRWLEETSRARGIPLADAAPLAGDRLLKNRSEMNTEAGYWIFEPTGAGIGHALTAEYPLEQITDAALMSDGFFDLYELFRLAPLDAHLFAPLREGEAPRLGRLLRRAEHADPGCDRYPRLKLADDATVLYGALS